MQRNKWIKDSSQIKMDILVLLKDELSAPPTRHLARVEQVHQDSDAIVRVVTVKTAKVLSDSP